MTDQSRRTLVLTGLGDSNFDAANDRLAIPVDSEGSSGAFRLAIPGAMFGTLIAELLKASRVRAATLSHTFEELPLPLHDATATSLEQESVGIHLQFRNDLRIGLLMDRRSLDALRTAVAEADKLLKAHETGGSTLRH